MGQEIVYCFKCQQRIVTADYGKGLAYQLENRSCCSRCAVDVLETLPPDAREELLDLMKAAQQRKQSKTSGALKAIKPGSASGSTRKIPVQAPPKSPAVLIGGLAAAGVVVLLLIVALMTKSSPPPPPPPPVVEKRPVVPDVRPGPSAEEQRRSAAAKEAMQKARDFAAANPKELHGQLRQWKAALTEAAGTGYEAEAKREVDRAEARVRDELGDLGRRIRELAAKKDLKGATELLNQSKPKLPPGAADELELLLRQLSERALAWSPLFDGRTTSFISTSSAAHWKVDNGALVHAVAGQDQAAQSREEYAEGEFRFRVSLRNEVSNWYVGVRQGGGGACRVVFYKPEVLAMGDGEHEVIVTCRGSQVSATLDGKPVKVLVDNQVLPKGRLQFNGKDGEFRVLAIDYRPLP